jgi:hypothetical protein
MFCINSKKIDTFLNNYLKDIYNLEYKQRSDFITYWLHQLTKKEWCIIQFMEQEVYEKFAELKINPVPDKIWRIFMLFKNSDVFVKNCLGEDDLNKIDVDKKLKIETEKFNFSIVEWGALNIL